MQGAVPEAAAARYVNVWLNVGTNGKGNVADVILQAQNAVYANANNVVFVVAFVVVVIVVVPVVDTDVAAKTIVPLQASGVKCLCVFLVEHGNYCAPVPEGGTDDALNGRIALNKVLDSKARGNAPA